MGYSYASSAVEAPLTEAGDGTAWRVVAISLPPGAAQGAFAPYQTLIETTADTEPPPRLAEAPVALAVPVPALVLFGGVFVVGRRRNTVRAVVMLSRGAE